MSLSLEGSGSESRDLGVWNDGRVDFTASLKQTKSRRFQKDLSTIKDPTTTLKMIEVLDFQRVPSTDAIKAKTKIVQTINSPG